MWFIHVQLIDRNWFSATELQLQLRNAPDGSNVEIQGVIPLECLFVGSPSYHGYRDESSVRLKAGSGELRLYKALFNDLYLILILQFHLLLQPGNY